MESKQRVAILASSLALLVFVAAFMPWGVIRGQPAFQIGGMPHFGGEPLVTGTVSMTATGWNGHLTLAGLSLPNWLVVLAAAAVAVLCWMRASNVWRAPGLLLIALAGYGLLHTGFTAFVMAKSSQATVGIGSLVGALAFLILLVILMRNSAGKDPRIRRIASRATDRGPEPGPHATRQGEAPPGPR